MYNLLANLGNLSLEKTTPKKLLTPFWWLFARCKIPELPNDTFAIQGDFHRAMVNRSIPVETSGGEESYSQCQLYVDRNSTHNRTGSDGTEDCQAWVYDTSQFDLTIATQVWS